MGGILNFLDAILDIGELYARYGIKGCLLIILLVVLILGAIVALVSVMGS